jgi:hypothetical protein
VQPLRHRGDLDRRRDEIRIGDRGVAEPILNNSDVRPRSHRVRATHPAQYETVLGGGDRLLIDPDDLLGGGDLRLQRRLGQHRENDVAGRIEIDRLQLEALIIDATCRRMPPNMSSVQDRLKPGLYSVNVGMLVPMKEPPNSALEIRSRVTEAEAPIEGICAPCSARRFSRASRNVTWAAARSGFASRAWVTSASMRDEWNRFHQSPGMSRRVRRRCAVPPVVAALAVRVGVGCSVKRSASGGAERWKSGPTVQPASMVAADSAARTLDSLGPFSPHSFCVSDRRGGGRRRGGIELWRRGQRVADGWLAHSEPLAGSGRVLFVSDRLEDDNEIEVAPTPVHEGTPQPFMGDDPRSPCSRPR